jgi:glucose-1-phosphate thymidylyltransferase
MNKKKVVAIIPAAGKGSRLSPFPCPKELFPVGYQDIDINGQVEKRPKVVSQYLLENLVSAGADRIFIILGDGKSDIMRYYGDGQRFGTNITYLYQENLNGMPSAIDLARYWLKDDTVLFGMPDTIIEPRNAFETLLDYHKDQDAVLTLGLFPTDNPGKFGMVDIDSEGNVIFTVDKPKETNLTDMWGCACWSPEFTLLIEDFLSKNKYDGKEIVLGDVFDYALKLKLKVKGLVFDEGKYIDIGTTNELNQALKQFHL